MICVAVDSEMHQQFTPLEYASDELTKLKDYLIHYKFPKIGFKSLTKNQLRDLTDRVKIETTLKDIFQADQYRWPQARWSTLYNFFFNELKLHFSDALSMTLDKL